MKKILFLFIILLAGVFALYKMDIKPEVKDVVKDVSINQPAAAPAVNNAAPVVPTQNTNVSK